MFKTLLQKTGAALLRASGQNNNIKLNASFEGASRGRRLGNWGLSLSGPNTHLTDSLTTLRNRSREVIRNNPHAKSAIESYVANMVGIGIKPRFKLQGQNEIKEQIQLLWNRWVMEADADGQMDFYGLQSLVARSTMESGEVLVRFRQRRVADGLCVPLQLQVIEADHLDAVTETISRGGNPIRMGIEFNRTGQRVAYHMSREHPGEMNISSTAKIRVPASEVLHIYRVLRPGQVRGIPWLAAVLVRLHELDQYEDAELVRKKFAAMITAFVTQSLDEDGDGLGKDEGEDAQGTDLRGIQPGAIHYLEPGEGVELSQPPETGGATLQWVQQQLRDIAAGIGVTYEQMTGDLSGVNYTSIRAGLLEFRRRVEMLQRQLLIFQLCRGVAERWLDTAVLSGVIKIPGYFENRHTYLNIDWRPPRWQHVEPLKDIQADILENRAGYIPRSNKVAERGLDVEDVDKQFKEDKDREESMDLFFDTNPSKLNRSGALQQGVNQPIDESENSDLEEDEDESEGETQEVA